MKKRIVAAVMTAVMTASMAMSAFAAPTSVDTAKFDGWWANWTQGIKVADGMEINFKQTTDDAADSNWHTVSYVVYTSTDAVRPEGKTPADLAAYAEVMAMRSDLYGWRPGTDMNTANAAFAADGYSKTDNKTPADWAAWLTACKAGVDSKIVLSIKDNILTAVYTVGEAESTVTMPIDATKDTYLMLTGEKCKADAITYEVKTADTPKADNTAKEPVKTSDAVTFLPIVLLAAAGIVAIAAKKRTVEE